MKKLKKVLSFLVSTPLHPQWLLLREEEKHFKAIEHSANGLVLDIGCSEQKLRRYLPKKCQYVGLDYPKTADEMYETKPTVYGDAQKLAFADNTFDTVSFLEVLEHLPNPQAAIQECYRVLKNDGKLFFSIPFLYPIHDAPFDFQRLTIYGLRELFNTNKFKIIEENSTGNPLMTAMLLTNIALVKTVLKAIEKRHLAVIIILLLPVLIPFLNMIGFLAEKLGPQDNFMVHGYTMQLIK